MMEKRLSDDMILALEGQHRYGSHAPADTVERMAAEAIARGRDLEELREQLHRQTERVASLETQMDAMLVGGPRVTIETLRERVRLLEEREKIYCSAIDRIKHNFKLLLARKPVRDASETIAEANAALAATDENTT